MKPKFKPPGTKIETQDWYTAFNFGFQIQLAPLHQGAREKCECTAPVRIQPAPVHI